jgi:DNA-directed RNA polymerase II subunit RPB1
MKRQLTSKEIEYILSDIKPIKNTDIYTNIHRIHIDRIKNQLVSCSIYPEMIDEVKKKLTSHYYKTQVSAGEAVGILTAQSIGERQTQLTLNTFQSTGITTNTVVTGVPRFTELLNVTKNPKNVITNIFFKEKHFTIDDLRKTIDSSLVHITLKQMIIGYELRTDTKPWYTVFTLLHGKKLMYHKCVRFTCDTDIMFKHSIELNHVASIIENAYDDLQCFYSTDNEGVLDVWFDNSDIEQSQVYIYLEQVIIPRLGELSIKGVPGITSIAHIKNKDVWVVEALGFNLKTLLSMKMIDGINTVSNNMWEVYNVLGTEATRQFLIEEIYNIVTVDSYINLRHVELLVDVMLYTGNISPISRYGVHRNQSGTLTKCSFEESLDQFLKAGVYAEDENIKGVSASIICGKVASIGTGLCDMVYEQQ